MAEAPSTAEGPAIGIDLGTTFTCVAVVREGRVEIIPNEQGKLTTPSFVAFDEHERMIGNAAKEQLAANAANTIFDAKRLIGRSFTDPIVQEDMKHWPFKVVEVNDMPKIEITYKGEVKRFSAEEVSAMVLGKMKEIAESYLNAKVTNAVITVPAYFNDMQRKATKDAGTIAGLNVSRIISEPTAAAIAYGSNNDTKTAKNVLIYDFGGGTFDVSILNIHENIFEVRATAGDSHLGGEDFDNRMIKYFSEMFTRKHNVDISEDKKALRKLRTACERAKRTLSSTTQTSIAIDSLCDGIDFKEEISRIRFEDMCADLFDGTIATVESALKDAELKHEDIDTIVLIGGSTRIPKIQKLLSDLFPGKEVSKTINADEAVAQGAAIQAAILRGNGTKEMESMVLMEVTPLTLGVAALHTNYKDGDPRIDFMSAGIKRNTRIPVCKRYIYRTSADNQTIICFRIIQGEHRLAEDNFEIGKFTIEGIPAAPAEVEKVFVRFSIDENGILTVSAVSKSNPKARGKISIKNVCGSLTETEIEQMIADAEMYREQDLKAKQYKTGRVMLEQYCIDIRKTYGSDCLVMEKCNEVEWWLHTCCRPNPTQFYQWKNELEALMSRKDADDSSSEESENGDDTDKIESDSSNGNIIVRSVGWFTGKLKSMFD